MTTRTALRCTFAFLTSLILATTAHAQLFRAYLASDGNDANACTLPAPCRLLPAALAAVVDGGEIWMLDSANYNIATVTIGKSVSILATPGAVGSILAIGGPAIDITAAGLQVGLRNLVIAPLPGGGATNGVNMTGNSKLTIEHSLIANLPFYAVNISCTCKLKIANTTLRNNTYYAVRLDGGATAEISGTQMLANNLGGILSGGSSVTTTTASVSDSVISGGNYGVAASALATGSVGRVLVTRSTIEGTLSAALGAETNGLGSAIVAVSNSMITNNTSAWYQFNTGSVIRTLGNNHIADNGGSVTGSLTLTPPQ